VSDGGSRITLPMGVTAAEAEKELILRTLRLTNNNKAEAARQLGLDVKTIRNKLKAYGIN
jgi:DNA-binding NtrC family response regulator